MGKKHKQYADGYEYVRNFLAETFKDAFRNDVDLVKIRNKDFVEGAIDAFNDNIEGTVKELLQEYE